mgnify:CR=1 FL=1
MSGEKEKVLVLCVDRDNDIGVKAGIRTPIFGRVENLDAASKLALIDPEESDANAIFGAVKIYDDLSSESNVGDCEIATVAGSEKGGLTADKNIRDRLREVLEKFPATNTVLVTDGFSDEEVIPIIQSHIQIMSVKRVVVRHSESIEESWTIFSRYLRKVVEDPYYARWVLGAPGLLLLIMGVLWQFVEIVSPGVVLLIVLGTLLIVKGFSIDKLVAELIYPSPPNLVRLFTTVTSLTIGGLAFYQTYGTLLKELGTPDKWVTIMPTVIGYALRYASDLVVIAFCIFIGGLGLYLYFMRDSRMLWSVVGLVFGVLMRIISLKVSEILLCEVTPVPIVYWIELSIIIVLSIVTTVAAIFATTRLGKRLEAHYKRMGTER